MANRNDIIRAEPQAAGQFTFTADNTVAEVAVNSVGGNAPFSADGTTMWFARGDNLLLKSVRIALPYQYGWGSIAFDEPSITMFWEGEDATLLDIPELGAGSRLILPTVCGEIQFPPDGLFLKQPFNLVAGRMRLVLGDITLNVSQINGPTILNGQELEVGIFLQVFHTLEMEP